jgi:hypothetical protein
VETHALPFVNLVSIVHLALLCLWGGVVATESVIELYPYRRSESHEHSIRFHFWIDLLVELPLIAGVLISGTALVVLAWPLTWTHALKIACAAVAVSANLYCIILVIRRGKALAAQAPDPELRAATRRIIMCAVVGLPFAAVAAGLGFFLAYHRLLALIAG